MVNYEEEKYLEVEEEEDRKEQFEEQQELMDEQEEIAPLNQRDSVYKLFGKVWKSGNSVKVANLNNMELGKPMFSVRDALHLADLGDLTHHHRFAEHFRRDAERTNATSMAKKGWFSELFVSNKKFTNRTLGSSEQPAQVKKKGWSLFGGSRNTE